MPTTVTPQQSASSTPAPPAQAIKPGQKQNKGLKVAFVVLVIMLVVILSEVGYLVFSGWGRTFFQLKSEEKNEAETIVILTPKPVSIELTEISKQEEKLESSKVDRLVYILDAIEPKESFVEAMTVSSVYKATVVSTSQEDINVAPRYVIDAKNDSGENIKFRFTEDEIASAEILLSSNNNEKISFDDIKTDDKLTLTTIIDLFDSSPDAKIKLEIERGN